MKNTIFAALVVFGLLLNSPAYSEELVSAENICKTITADDKLYPKLINKFITRTNPKAGWPISYSHITHVMWDTPGITMNEVSFHRTGVAYKKLHLLCLGQEWDLYGLPIEVEQI